MPTAPHPAGLAYQANQGVAARFVHRLGGALRSAFAGISRRANLRRPPAPRATRIPPAAKDPESPKSSRRPRAPRRPRAGPQAAPAKPGWIARWFGLGRKTAQSRRPPLPANDAPYTPETHPGLSPEACAILNTPVKDCDPELLRLVLASLALHLADALPPELGLSDPRALFSTLWGRLAAPAEQPDETPASPVDAEPAAPLTPPDQLPETPQAPEPLGAATAAAELTPDLAILPIPGRHRSQARRRDTRRLFRACRTPAARGLRNAQHRLPARRLCYAACAGPP